MNDAVNVNRAAVQCDDDACNFEEDVKFSEIPSWHNVTCPDCGKTIIVNDEDLAAFNAFSDSVNLINSTLGEISEDEPLVEFTISSKDFY